jgi:hypothetical protein
VKILIEALLTESASVSVNMTEYETALKAKIADLVASSKRPSRLGPADPISDEDAARYYNQLSSETKQSMTGISKKVSAAISRVPVWGGSKVEIRAKIEPDSMLEHGANDASVVVGKSADFTLFSGDSIDDIIEAGDSDFFTNPVTEMDYFNLIDEIRNPGKTAKQGNKVLTLFTARPVKDRKVFDGVKQIPSRIFLSSSEDDAGGIASDFGGRDLYIVKVLAKNVMLTLKSGRLSHYQTIVTPNGKVPVESIELV